MRKLKQIDQQIEKLQHKKKELEVKQAIFLQKNLQKIFKEDCSETFLLGLATWAKSELKKNAQLKETWQQAGEKFCKPTPAKN
jgi:hypothetical protein